MMSEPLIKAAQRLASILTQENDALKAMDLRLAAELLPEKTAAFAALTISENARFEPPNPALISIAQRLNGLASENRHLLKRAIEAQQRVIGIIVRAASAAAMEPSYAAGGHHACLAGPVALSTRA